jgi:hypothetical protein
MDTMADRARRRIRRITRSFLALDLIGDPRPT